MRMTIIIREGFTGVLSRYGKLVETLAPGRHVRWGRGWQVMYFDMRLQQMLVATQEIADRDGVPIRLTARVDYRIANPMTVVRATDSWYGVLYSYVQEAMREIVIPMSIEEILANRVDLGPQIMEIVAPEAEAIGLEILKVVARDFGTVGEIRRAAADLIVAQKQAAAALERARGEQAALRSLANAARVMAGNPALLQLRWIQAIGQVERTTLVVHPGNVGEVPIPDA